MGHLALGERPRRLERQPRFGWRCCFGEPAHPKPIHLPAVALEAERVVSISPHLAPIPESGLPFLARRAQDPDPLRPTVALLARHRRPSRPAGAGPPASMGPA